MEQQSIQTISAWTGGSYRGPDLPVDAVEIDSRRVRPGALFVPLRGARHDGHDFLGEAFASGAAAALVDRAEVAAAHRALGHAVVEVADTRRALGDLARGYRRTLDLDVVAVTGSNGKTTTKEMLRLVLGPCAVTSPHSYNNDIGVPLTLLSATRNHSVCVVEMGTNRPGEIAALADLARPDVGVVLNVGESHLERLGDLDGVAAEKGALVEALGPHGCAVLNYDDERTRAMAARTSAFLLTFGTWPGADVYAGQIRPRGRSVSFSLLLKKRVVLKTLGVHNVHNALAAAAVAMWFGHHPFDVCERLRGFRPAPMRMEEERVGGVRLINDAYNANPRSTLAAVQEICYRTRAGRRVLVLGDMLELGPAAEQLHARVGEQAARARVDVLWAVGPFSRAAAEAARAAGVRTVHWSPDVPTAAAELPFRARSGDVVLFKASRGVRLETLYQAVRDDLRARRGSRTRAAEEGARLRA